MILLLQTGQNHAPIADAGEDQTVNIGDFVQLDGSNSYDPDGDNLTYQWIAPEEITLDDPTSETPTFTAPLVPANEEFAITLSVFDGELYSELDAVLITIIIENNPPVANAGEDQEVIENTLVTLDGSASYDPDGNEISYLWTAPEGIILDDVTAINPTFIAPENTEVSENIYSLLL